MDFSKIKSFFIPEGKVKSLSINGRKVWGESVESGDQLTAPTISLDGDTLTITTTDSRTETFAIFVDGVEVITVEAPKSTQYYAETNESGGMTYVVTSNNYSDENGVYQIGG